MRSGIFFLLFSLVSGLSFAQTRFKAICETRQALAGSSFRIEFRLENAEGRQFNPPDFGGLQLLSGPSRSMSTSVINGRMSSSMGYVYTLAGAKPGKYRIAAASIMVGSQLLRSEPIEIEILPANMKSDHSQEYFIKAEINTKKAFVGQQLILKYKIYTRVNIDNIELAAPANLGEFYKEYIATGDGNPHRVVENGIEYQCQDLGIIALYPMKTGQIKIPPATYRLILGSDDPWGMGMPSIFNRQASVISTNPLEIQVRPYPEPIPQGFSGAVGYFITEFEPIQRFYTMSDAIEIKMSLSGNGHFPSIKYQLNIPDSLFSLSASNPQPPTTISKDSLIIQTVKSNYLLTPKKTGSFHFTPEFIYLDPLTEKYVIHRDSMHIEIQAGSQDLVQKDTLENIFTNFEPADQQLKLFDRFWNWIILLIPALVGIFLHLLSLKSVRSKNDSKEKTPKNNNQSVRADAIELLLFQKIQNHFPESKNIDTLFGMKQFLQHQNEPKAESLLKCMMSLEWIKYKPQVEIQELQLLQDQINAL